MYCTCIYRVVYTHNILRCCDCTQFREQRPPECDPGFLKPFFTSPLRPGPQLSTSVPRATKSHVGHVLNCYRKTKPLSRGLSIISNSELSGETIDSTMFFLPLSVCIHDKYL